MMHHLIKIIVFIPLMISSMQNPGLSELRCFSLKEQNALKEFAQKLVQKKEEEKRLEEERAKAEKEYLEQKEKK